MDLTEDTPEESLLARMSDLREGLSTTMVGGVRGGEGEGMGGGRGRGADSFDDAAGRCRWRPPARAEGLLAARYGEPPESPSSDSDQEKDKIEKLEKDFLLHPLWHKDETIQYSFFLVPAGQLFMWLVVFHILAVWQIYLACG